MQLVVEKSRKVTKKFSHMQPFAEKKHYFSKKTIIICIIQNFFITLHRFS